MGDRTKIIAPERGGISSGETNHMLIPVASRLRRNLTTACTRPPTRALSCSSRDAGRRVMPGVRLLLNYGEHQTEQSSSSALLVQNKSAFGLRRNGLFFG